MDNNFGRWIGIDVPHTDKLDAKFRRILSAPTTKPFGCIREPLSRGPTLRRAKLEPPGHHVAQPWCPRPPISVLLGHQDGGMR